MPTNPQDIEGRTFQPVDLRGGLDLTASKFNVQPGTLQDVLNYESSDEGYSRSQGLLLFDGTLDKAVEDMWVIDTTVGAGGESILTGDTFTLGGTVTWTDLSPVTPGQVANTATVAFWDYDTSPSPDTVRLGLMDVKGVAPAKGMIVTDDTTGDSLDFSVLSVAAPVILSEHADADTISEYLAYINDTVNTAITGQAAVAGSLYQHGQVPGVGGITGGFQFRDDVYAVRDFYSIPFDIGVAQPTLGELLIVPITATGASVTLRDWAVGTLAAIDLTSNTWAEGTAVGNFIISNIIALDYDSWGTGLSYNAGETLVHNDLQYICYLSHTSGVDDEEPGIGGNWANYWKLIDITEWDNISDNDDIVIPPSYGQIADMSAATAVRKGALWRATTEGWCPVDTGYTIEFDDGENAPSVRDAPLFVSNMLPVTKNDGALDWGTPVNIGAAPFTAWTSLASGTGSDNTYATVTLSGGQTSQYLAATIDSSSVPSANVRVVGVEVGIEVKDNGSDVTDVDVVLSNAAADADWYVSSNRARSEDIAGTDTIYTYGSSTDIWGVFDIDPQHIIDGDLSVRVQYVNGSGGSRTVDVDNVTVTIYYVPEAEHVYVYDGSADVSEADITAWQVTNGLDVWGDPTVAEVLATGTMSLLTGAGGSIDSVTVDGIELLAAPVAYNTSLSQTATDVASDITSGWGGYTAAAVSTEVTITAATGTGTTPNGFIVESVPTTMTTFETDMNGGVASADPTLPAGIMTLYNVTNPHLITAGMELWTGASGTGELVADTAGEPTYNTLPSQAEMKTEESMYQNIVANFFSDSEAEAVYGVTGASHAFSYNGTFFSYIRTPLLVSADKPRHVEFHVNMLALGYATGHVLMSTVGAPHDFSAANGGTSWGFRKAVTGLQSLPGAVMSVLTRSSTSSLEGTDPSSMSQKNIQPSSGALEYTLQNIIQPFFMDFYGLSNVATTDKFGDFDFGRISEVISPWLRNRLQASPSTNVADITPIAALAVRNKNQYRLYFNDGYILTASFFTDRNIEFTWQHYDTTNFSADYTPMFLNSFVMSSGRERSIMGTADGDVYIIDGANGIQNGSGLTEMDAYITINPINMGRPESVTKYQHTVVQGQFYGWQQLEAWADTNYVFDEAGAAQETVNIGASTNATQLDSTNDLDSIYLPILADGYSLKLQTSVDGSKPHTLQSLILRASLKGTDRNRTTKAY